MTIRLIVALHGVGSCAADIAPFGEALAAAIGAEAVALDGPEPYDMPPPRGRQWFSIKGVTETNRPARVAAALPGLLARIDGLAHDRGVARNAIALAGFSQGSIMSLAAVVGGGTFGAVVAVAGRLAAPLSPARSGSPAVLLLHDKLDTMMPFPLAGEAEAALRAAGHDVSLMASEGYGHAIGADMTAAAIEFLRGL
ncbi:dienelactone hydrolase family protein [Flavisphingomonas formosensis]|uniref:dienelactone hydrolase family protein n=1 Tax=Flavisphingomonas formosensis TaxID=861534 RepID=UPI0012FCC6BC|nr:dienelactone hydrolase family protein [Sphingomonas formosensis]